MHMDIGYISCATSDRFVHAFCTGKLCSTRVGIKLLPHEGKARHKHRPVNERKPAYIQLKVDWCEKVFHDHDVAVKYLRTRMEPEL